MIGGIIEQILPTDSISILSVRDGNDFCCVNVQLNGEPVAVGDRVWWQDRFCYWNPDDGSRSDVPIERIGYAYSPDKARELGYVLMKPHGETVLVNGDKYGKDKPLLIVFTSRKRALTYQKFFPSLNGKSQISIVSASMICDFCKQSPCYVMLNPDVDTGIVKIVKDAETLRNSLHDE